MSRSPTDTRERLLEATWRLLEQRRGQGVRLEDIAQAAGVSRQALYLHFGSRAELFIATVRYVDEALRLPARLVRLRRACESGEGALGIREMVAFWGNYMPDIYGLAKGLLALRDTDEAAAAAWADRMTETYQGCVSAVEQAADAGMLAPAWTVETAAQFFWAMLSIEVWERLVIEYGWTQEQYIARIQRAVTQALLIEPPE